MILQIMSVKAKFKVTSYTSNQHSKYNAETGRYDQQVEMRTIELSPVMSSEEGSENKKFWDASPPGSIKLGTINPAAWEYFELGAEYYIDFTKAE